MIRRKQPQKKQKEATKVVFSGPPSAAAAQPTRATPADFAITAIAVDSSGGQPVKDAAGSSGAQTSPTEVVPAPVSPEARLVPARPRPNDAVVGASPGVLWRSLGHLICDLLKICAWERVCTASELLESHKESYFLRA